MSCCNYTQIECAAKFCGDFASSLRQNVAEDTTTNIIVLKIFESNCFLMWCSANFGHCISANNYYGGSKERQGANQSELYVKSRGCVRGRARIFGNFTKFFNYFIEYFQISYCKPNNVAPLAGEQG